MAESGFLQGTMFESQFNAPDLVCPIGPIGLEDILAGHLGGKPGQVQRGRAAGQYSPAELAGESPGNLVDIRLRLLLQQFAIPGIVVDTADDPPNR
jgi:hypothetical protein